MHLLLRYGFVLTDPSTRLEPTGPPDSFTIVKGPYRGQPALAEAMREFFPYEARVGDDGLVTLAHPKAYTRRAGLLTRGILDVTRNRTLTQAFPFTRASELPRCLPTLVRAILTAYDAGYKTALRDFVIRDGRVLYIGCMVTDFPAQSYWCPFSSDGLVGLPFLHSMAVYIPPGHALEDFFSRLPAERHKAKLVQSKIRFA